MAKGIYADIYTLLGSRSRAQIEQFLNCLSKAWTAMAESYTLQGDDEAVAVEFDDVDSVLDYCQTHPHVAHALYWRNATEAEPLLAMAFFTPDGDTIVGVSVDDEGQEARFESALLPYSSIGSVVKLYESPPPTTATEFVLLARGISG